MVLLKLKLQVEMTVLGSETCVPCLLICLQQKIPFLDLCFFVCLMVDLDDGDNVENGGVLSITCGVECCEGGGVNVGRGGVLLSACGVEG